MAVAGILAGTAAAVRPEAQWVQDLTRWGASVYEFAATEGALPASLKILTDPFKNVGEFIAANYAREGGLNTIGAWAGSLAFYISLLPLVYLLNYGFQRLKGNRVPFNLGGMTQSLLSTLGRVFAMMNYPFQKYIWASPIIRQYNLYKVLEAGRDPFQTPEAWNSPLASRGQITENLQHLDARINSEKALEYAASRLVALLLVAEASGIDPATLDLASQDANIQEFIGRLLVDRDTSQRWIAATGNFYTLLKSVIELNEVPVSREQVQQFTRDYRKTAEEILREVNQTHAQLPLSFNNHAKLMGIARNLGDASLYPNNPVEVPAYLRSLAQEAREIVGSGEIQPPLRNTAQILDGVGSLEISSTDPAEARQQILPVVSQLQDDLTQAAPKTLTPDDKRSGLVNLARNAWSAFNGNFLQLLAFGTPGLKAYQNFRNIEITASVARKASGMAIADYPLSAFIWAFNSPQAWIWPGQPRIIYGQAEQVLSWNMGPQFDVAANEAQAARINPYAPLNTYALDPTIGGVVRQQSFEAGLVSILKGQLDPNPSAPSILRTWMNYMWNVPKFLQAKLMLSGVPTTLGFSLAYLSGERTFDFMGLPVSVAIPITAAFTTLWYYLIKYSIAINDKGSFSPNYAVVWPVVNTFLNHTDNHASQNRAEMTKAVGLLSSSDPTHYQAGAKLAKSLFNAGNAYLPDQFNKRSADYSETDAKAFAKYLLTPENLPVATATSTLLDMLVLNIAIGALGSTVVYDTLSAGIFNPLADAVRGATHALGWFGGTFGALYVADKVVSRYISPHMGYLHKPVTYATDKIHAVGSHIAHTCGAALIATDGRPLIKPSINLE